jgi:hypothetical protein
MEAYDAGLVNFRDPTSVKFRNQAEEKMKEQEALDYQDPVKAEEAKNAGNEFFKQENWGDGNIRAACLFVLSNLTHSLLIVFSNSFLL